MPLNLTASVSLLYLKPLQSSQWTIILGRKFISIVFFPAPLQTSHLPPTTLKENLPDLYPLILDSSVFENNSLISVNTPVYVAGLDLGVLPIGAWLISITLSIFSIPLISPYGKGFFSPLKKYLFKIGYNVSLINDDFPLPETPVTQQNKPRGIFKLISFRLFPFAENNSKNLPLPFLLISGIEISFLPLKKSEVIFFDFIISL